MQLKDNTFLVTGGASGLGEATSAALIAAGARVVIADLGASDGKATAERLGDNATFAPIDITDEDSFTPRTRRGGVVRPAARCRALRWSRGRSPPHPGQGGQSERSGQLPQHPRDQPHGHLQCAPKSRRADGTQRTRRRERGSIVLTASVAAFDGQIGQTAYTASKAAVHGLTLVAARDLASVAIRVNTIAPGTFDTPMLARLRSDIRDGLAAGVPFPKRLGRPEDYAGMALALLENGYANGETIRLDGAIRMPPR